MATDALRITYRRSGGIAGIDMTATADGAELPADEARVAAALLHHPGRATERGSAPGRPDAFTYELHVEDGRRSRSLRWAEHEVPDDARALLKTLHGRAAPAR